MVSTAGSDREISLFVYGSLKRAEAHHSELRGSPFVGEARTAACFALRMISGYPALVFGARSIRGELFRISLVHLVSLDAFEGEGYARSEIALVDGRRVSAYLSRRPQQGFLLDADEWPVPLG